MKVDHIWPVETEGNTSLENIAGANRAARVNELFGGRVSLLEGFFEDFSKSCLRILAVARFKIISDQGAFDGSYERSRKICFRVQLVL